MSSAKSPIETNVTDDPRSAILTAAIEILGAHGAGALTVRSVATAAGCSTTGVYTWFGGKNGLIDAIFDDGFTRFGRAIAAPKRRTTQLARLEAMSMAYRNWAVANPTHYMVMFGGAVPDYVPSEAAMITAGATYDQLVAAVTAAASEIEFIAAPEDIAFHVWAGIHGYVSLQVVNMDRASGEAERLRRYRFGLQQILRAVTV